MSPNRRIILNILATYGRTVIGVLCGIFSTRWVLMALGKEDFGLFGLVGSLVIFLSFFNIQFAGALSRFYAYAIGQAKVASNLELALEECRKWFSVGVAIHTIVPFVLIVIGYPIGAWAIHSGTVGVPEYRIDACIWLWRFVCISSLISMVNVPFSAMYTAKQHIAELTIYSLAQTIVRTMFIYFMTLRQGDWLVLYGLVTCLILIVPQMLICFRARIVFPECRFRLAYVLLWGYARKLTAYAGWQTFGGLGYLARHQFLTVVVNRFFGPKITASFSIGGTASGEAAALTGAMNTAFAPAITTACGEGDWDRMRKMAYRACKFGTLLTLIFAIPLGLEISEVLQLWLRDVPQWTDGICVIMLVVVVVEKLSIGHGICINASGHVARFQIWRGIACLTAIPFALGAALIFRHVYAVAFALLATTCIACLSDVWVARTQIGLSTRYWFSAILIPLGVITLITCGIGIVSRLFLAQSFWRLIVTTAVVVASIVPLSWFILLDLEEKCYCKRKLWCIANGFWRRLLSKGDDKDLCVG